MRKRFQLAAVIVAFLLVGLTALPTSGRTSTVPGFTVERAARERSSGTFIGALSDYSEDPGVIAYVRRSTHDIHVIAPDGTGDRLLWTAPYPQSPWPAYELAWRPDGGELAFSSDHEETCSYFESDVYAIRPTGTGYRRITNSPACAALAGLPKGSVTVDVSIYSTPGGMVYVQGAPGAIFATFGTMTFDNVADFGPGVLQRAVGIYTSLWGEYRTEGYPPYADVLPGQTVAGGSVLIPGAGISQLGAGKFAWKPDGSGLAYAMRTGSRINQIAANPPYGSIGEEVPVVDGTAPTLVAWGPDAAHSDLYLYYSRDDGIYLSTLATPGAGTKLVDVVAFEGETVFDIEWLPDASGFLYSKKYVNLGIWTNIFEYSFATGESTEITHLPDDNEARAFSLSPDSRYIVFEWVTEPWDPTSDLYIVDRDGTGLQFLVEDAGRPAWGPTYVPEAVHAEFTAAPTSGVRPLLVQFTNQSTGDYDTCTWTFGDGATSTSCGNPTHSYATKGIYTVALTVSGPGGSNLRTRAGYITVYDPVDADFSGSPTTGIPPLSVTFINQSTGDYDTCGWTFGDGGTSSACNNPTHTYTTKGVYTVVLTVSGAGGTDTRTRAGYITVYEPVQADFAGSPTAGISPLLVTFANQSTGDYSACAWTFGDGGTSSACSNPTHTYTTKGVYTVVLTVSGAGGTDAHTRAGYITVHEPVQADFAGSPAAGGPPLLVAFTNQSRGDYDACAWTFGDGGTSSSCGNPTHTYATEGVYTVALTVSGPGGIHTRTRDRYITVQDEYLVYLPLVLAGH